MPQKYVLDSTALMEWPTLPKGELYIPISVSSEAKSLGSQLKLDKVKVLPVRKESREKVLKMIKKTGTKISETDIDIISLSIDINAVLVSDDYSVQNLCAFLGVKFLPLSKPGIKKKYTWGLKCSKCGSWLKSDTCEMCGGKGKKAVFKEEQLA